MLQLVPALDPHPALPAPQPTNIHLPSPPSRTSKSLDKDTSLEEYIERMKEGQKDIYFVSGASLEEAQNSPFVEKLLKKDYEVGAAAAVIHAAGWGSCNWRSTTTWGSGCWLCCWLDQGCM